MYSQAYSDQHTLACVRLLRRYLAGLASRTAAHACTELVVAATTLQLSAKMESKQVAKGCLGFSIANGWTMASYPEMDEMMLEFHSQTRKFWSVAWPMAARN